MTLARLFATAAIVTLAAACVAPKPQPRLAHFIAEEYAPYEVAGSGSIEGQAFLKTRAGDVKYGAGNPVYLNPVTTYSTEWYTRTVLNGESLEPADERAMRYHRTTVADGDGRFRFDALPPGEYYVACQIYWEVPTGGLGLMPTGGFARTKVLVQDGETVRAIVSY